MTTESRAAPAGAWRNRIVGHADVAPSELVPNPRNWRGHPPEQQRALAGALGEVGWVAEVLVNRTTGHVVDGHLRIELALARLEPTVPVTYVELSEDEERLVLASLDPLAAMATAEQEQLAALLAGLQPADEALRALLDDLARESGLDDLRRGLVDPDDVPEIPAEPYVRPGDLWILGNHRLLCGDATNPDDVVRLLDSAEPTLLATDPPYGVSLDPTWRDGVYNELGPAEQPYMRTKGHRNTTVSGDTRVDWSDAFALVPSLEVGYVWHAGVHAAQVAAGLERIGFEIAAQVIWDKGLFAMGRSWYHWAHEPCWVIRKPGVPHLFLGSRDQSTVWRAPSPKMIMGGSEEEKQDHPAQKPVLLYETPIRNHLRASESCYDPFVGSGTCFIAAETLDRRCYGLEIDPRYVQVTIERWQAFTGATAARVDD
jgi:DNA modification methylase